MHVYSTPMTPPPTTISVLGISGMSRIWSLLTMVRPLSGTVALVAGLVPVVMMTVGASRSLWPREFSTRTCVASRKLARPVITSTPLRVSCAWVTSTSVLITWLTRKPRSAMVIFSLT